MMLYLYFFALSSNFLQGYLYIHLEDSPSVSEGILAQLDSLAST